MKFILDCRRLIKFHYIIHNVLSTRYVGTRDLPGNALVLKQKYNLENRSKRQYWITFQLVPKLWEITASFISLYWKHQENTLFIFECCQYIEL